MPGYHWNFRSRSSGTKKKRKRETSRSKIQLIVSCPNKSSHSSAIDGRVVILHHKKLYIDLLVDEALGFRKPAGHRFAGYFLPHPDHEWGWRGEGLLSAIPDDPPQLNWIYIDQETYVVKCGTKAESEADLVGPGNWSKVGRRMMFEGWEGFLAVEEKAGIRALYFDGEDDGLRGKVPRKRTVEVELSRKEIEQIKENANEKN